MTTLSGYSPSISQQEQVIGKKRKRNVSSWTHGLPRLSIIASTASTVIGSALAAKSSSSNFKYSSSNNKSSESTHGSSSAASPLDLLKGLDSISSAMNAALSNNNFLMNDSLYATNSGPSYGSETSWYETTLTVFKVIIVSIIIFAAIFGNLLVIISVARHYRLRITTNYFIVSLACADILVAAFAMSFNAITAITGKWIFNRLVCDFWNSCDVLFSTASIMHLCCISLDRYYAIIKPLDYPRKITTKTVAIMLAVVWSSSTLTTIPILFGWYTTAEHLESQRQNPDKCEFVVNTPYCIISSSVSFWIPCSVMLFTYWKIYREATKQEKMLAKSQIKPAQIRTNRANSTVDPNRDHIVVSGPGGHRNSHVPGENDPESGQSTPTKRSINKMKREHKAAKTLGIILGAFIACWLPFFIGYVVVTVCESCKANTPDVVIDILFWIGYFNSSLNPIIYAYFNREFREAFKETIQNVFCCCVHMKCLETRRNSDALQFTAVSTAHHQRAADRDTAHRSQLDLRSATDADSNKLQPPTSDNNTQHLNHHKHNNNNGNNNYILEVNSQTRYPLISSYLK